MRTILALGLMAAALAPGLARADDEADAERRRILDRFESLRRNPDGLDAGERLRRFTDLYLDSTVLEAPGFATFIGDPRWRDRWHDLSPEAIERRDEQDRRFLDFVRSLDREALDTALRLDYDLLRRQLELGVEGRRFPSELLAVSQISGVHQLIPRLLEAMPTATTAHYEDILARLREVPRLVDQTRALLERGIEAGVTPPRITLRDVPRQLDDLAPDDPLASALLRPFVEFPASIPPEEQRRLRDEAAAIYREDAAPALRRLRDFLADRYVPAARESIAATDLPDGAAWYAYDVRQMTTTELTPDQIHEIGLAEVRRIRQEMERVVEESGFDGTLEEFLEFLRTDPQFIFETPDELLAACRDIAKRADPELVRLFGRLPRLPYGVKPVPSFMEKSAPSGYMGGTLKGARPGYVQINTYDLPSRPRWELEALMLHEGVPGHHLQFAIAQELEGLPWYRRHGRITAYTEGWGLYSEGLGDEMGFYRDPYSKFGRLDNEMWRAIRLVVDTGMHARGWTRQQAIDYFLENTGKAQHDAVVEVDRYIAWPGQALAYKIGELKIKELRAEAERELGERFDVRAFHDVVLGSGPVPLDVLEGLVRAWIAEQAEGGDGES